MANRNRNDSDAQIQYGWIPGGSLAYALLEECSRLYTEHYGRWGARGPRPGQPVALSPDRLAEWFASGKADLFYGKRNGELIGYAIAARGEVKGLGLVGWVTQLVVHRDYRDRGVARQLLSASWGISDYYAWGIVTASPYAVRALEKATRRRCRPLRIGRDHAALFREGQSLAPYVRPESLVVVHRDVSRIFTEFFVDHDEVPRMIEKVVSLDVPWLLGTLAEGWEWFAFTFQDQDKIRLTDREVIELVVTSNQVAQEAYGRMSLGESQKWMSRTEYETNLAMEWLELAPGHRVLDFGCGAGRHTIAFAQKGCDATGIDYVKELVDEARRRSDGLTATFITGDVRNVKLAPAKAAVCLYDVVGSFVERADNASLLANMASHLEPGGRLLLSVMNYDMIASRATHTFSFATDPNRVLDIPPSGTMESSGEVFDPEHCLVDTRTHVVYRREQFLEGDGLPVELLVRDRRFTRDEIEDMCRASGLEVVWSRHVHLGHWEDDLVSTDSSAKEILVLCMKP